jgi:hypothetical protein
MGAELLVAFTPLEGSKTVGRKSLSLVCVSLP